MRLKSLLFVIIISVLMIKTTLVASSADLDIAINNGRVIDPESQFDGIAHVGIKNGRIVSLSNQPLDANVVVDATAQVVAPGFIDIHTHTPTPFATERAVLDGITTQLDTEAGAYPISAYGELIEAKPRIHFGASVGHYATRLKVIDGLDQPYFFHRGKSITMDARAWEQIATPEQIKEIEQLLEAGLKEGGIGIGVLLDYMTDAISKPELEMIFRLAARYDAPVFTHVRRGLPGDPAGLEEILDLAVKTQTPVFICHITHNAMGGITEWLAKIDEARSQGARVATETLSYLAGGTSISADVFRKRDWRSIFDIDYSDVQWVATGEWLTEQRWNYYSENQPGGSVNHHYVKEAWLQTALQWPDMMISTDALPAFSEQQLTNPNIAGTYSRVLGRYVREQGILSLSDALARMSLKQAQWLESIAPEFAQKGRVQVGKDADLVIFDPNTVAANAEYGAPYLPPTGIHWVLVNGQIVVRQGNLVPEVFPGNRLGVSRARD